LDELSEKYQRLLQEFSKIKAQHSILRKAVINEQSNNTKLVEQLKQKENELRKYNQDLEVLNFHNKGLSKKVETLQGSNNKPFKTGWLSTNGRKRLEELNVQLEAATLDLENKIYENEKLHGLIDDLKSDHEIKIEIESNKKALLEEEIKELKVSLCR
ncbi:hypothetical protein K502DRAFT_287576, partial [Neoconidiobolus thromboides FSU 785]